MNSFYHVICLKTNSFIERPIFFCDKGEIVYVKVIHLVQRLGDNFKAWST